MILLISSTVVYASTGTRTVGDIYDELNSASPFVTGVLVPNGDSVGIAGFTGDGGQPTSAEMREVTRFMSALAEDKNVPQATKTDFYKELERTNSSAYGEMVLLLSSSGVDIAAGMTVLAPVTPLIAVALGVLTVVVSFFFSLTTVADLLYIGNEALWNPDKKDDSATGIMRLVSKSARRACVESVNDRGDANNRYRSPYGIWLRYRSWSYILLTISIYLLVTNQLNVVALSAINLVSGILGLLGLM